MATPTEPNNHINSFIHSTTANFLSLLSYQTKTTPSRPSMISMPILFGDSPPNQPLAFSSSESTQSKPSSNSVSSSVQGVSPGSASGFPSTVRISGLKSSGKGGGPAFVGQVFSMCDLSGTGLMAVSTHFDIPFISKRTPEWIKNIFATVTNSRSNGPVFRFFMDVGDAGSIFQ